MPYCEYCGEEVEMENYDEDQFGHKHYICNTVKCNREFRRDCLAAEDERRYRAEEDGYSRY